MTPLSQAALGVTPLTAEEVEEYSPLGHLAMGGVRKLILSHERLRAEVQGLEIMLSDAEKAKAELVAACGAMLAALNDESVMAHVFGMNHEIALAAQVELAMRQGRAAIAKYKDQPT